MADFSGDPDLDDFKGTWTQRWGYMSMTVALALLFMGVHFVFLLFETYDEVQSHQQTFAWGDFLIKWIAATFENMQSEMWQIVWQIIGTGILLEKYNRSVAMSDLRRQKILEDKLARIENLLNNG